MLGVALVLDRVAVGGIGTVTADLAVGLRDLGVDVEVVETRCAGDVLDPAFRDVRVRRFRPRHWNSDVAHSRRIVGYLRRFDHLIVSDAAHLLSACTMLKSNTRVHAIVHSPLEAMLDNVVRSADRLSTIIAVCPRIEQLLADRMLGLSTRRSSERHSNHVRLTSIYNGITVPEHLPRLRAECSDLRILYAGRLHPEKGCLRIPGILTELRRRGVGFRVGIVGAGPDAGRLEEELRRTCRQRELAWYGKRSVEQTRELMQEYDCFLLPSLSEGFPMAVLEALAAGCVPVVSDLPGHTDSMVESGKTGVLVKAGDIVGFAEALESLYLRRGELTGMRVAGWKAVRETFSSAGMHRRYHDVLVSCEAPLKAPRPRMNAALLGGATAHLPRLIARGLRSIVWRVGKKWAGRRN